jgi:integrase
MDQMKIDLPHLLQDKDRHGKVRVYYRRAGKKMVRLHAAPGTPEFLEEYTRAVNGLSTMTPPPQLTKAPSSSLRWLVEGYYASANFKTLSASTQNARRGILDHICTSMIETSNGSRPRGELPYAQMKAKHVRAIRDEKIDLPEAANGRLKALGQVFAWAIEGEYVQVDPTAAINYLPSASDGFHTWTADEVLKFEAHHKVGSKARLALALLLFTGVRRSDVVKLGRQMERQGVLHFTETKGRDSKALSRKKKTTSPKKRALPILPQLRLVIDATPSGNLNYLMTTYGRPFTAAGFGNKFREWCDEAGLEHCSAHGLRKAGATIAAANGASIHQLAAIFGWENLRQAELYTREANRARLAGDSMHLLIPRSGNKDGA